MEFFIGLIFGFGAAIAAAAYLLNLSTKENSDLGKSARSFISEITSHVPRPSNSQAIASEEQEENSAEPISEVQFITQMKEFSTLVDTRTKSFNAAVQKAQSSYLEQAENAPELNKLLTLDLTASALVSLAEEWRLPASSIELINQWKHDEQLRVTTGRASVT